MDPKQYRQDFEGPQPVPIADYPEVVPKPAMGRNSSHDSPQAYTPHNAPPFYIEKSEGFGRGSVSDNYLSAQNSPTQLIAPDPPMQFQRDDDEKMAVEKERDTDERRVFGLRRKWFFIVLGAVAVVVILAAVLGGVLGTVLPKKNHDDNSQPEGGGGSGSGSGNSTANSTSNPIGFTAQDKTGLALLTPPGSSSLYVYYLNDGGNIIEAEFLNASWEKSGGLPSSISNIAKGPVNGSPLAAVAYTMSGTAHYRQLFYIDARGLVTTINTTGNGQWNAPYNPTPSVASMINTTTLSAVADTNSEALNGIRVYFGASAGNIQEIGVNFSEDTALPVWHVWFTFPGSDGTAGVASSLLQNANHLYLRNATTGLLQQWTWDYVNVTNVTFWQQGVNSTSGEGTATGGNIAATNDGSATEYLYYQDENHKTVRYLVSGGSLSNIKTDVAALNEATVAYSLAAAWSSSAGKAVVLNQNSSASTQLLFSSDERSASLEEYTIDTA